MPGCGPETEPSRTGSGKLTVILTRESGDNEELARLIRSDGIEVIDYPCIEIRPVEPPSGMAAKIADPGRYDAIVFTSRRSVPFFSRIMPGDEPPRGAIIAAVGGKTAQTLRKAGMEVHVTTREQTGEALGEALARRLKKGDRVLYVRGNLMTGTLKAILEKQGMDIDELIVYENVEPALEPLSIGGRCAVVCASPSALERFVRANPKLKDAQFVAIGPVTAGSMAGLGLKNIITAGKPDSESLRSIILDIFESPRD
ncbi:MAG: uroporphyrinogen-III synthase [Pseudomonadota bacterium]